MNQDDLLQKIDERLERMVGEQKKQGEATTRIEKRLDKMEANIIEEIKDLGTNAGYFEAGRAAAHEKLEKRVERIEKHLDLSPLVQH